MRIAMPLPITSSDRFLLTTWATTRVHSLHRVEVRDDVRTVLLLLEAREGHVGALNVLLGVLKVIAAAKASEHVNLLPPAGAK